MKVHRFDDKRGNRFYYFKKDGEVVVASGITSWIGMVSTEREAIEKWKKMHPNWPELLNAASEYGTLMHVLYEGMLRGEGINKAIIAEMEVVASRYGKSAEMASKDALAFSAFIKEKKLKPLSVNGELGVETMLPYKLNGEWMCMTIDLLCEIETVEKVKVEREDGVYSRGPRKGEPKIVVDIVETVKKEVCLIDFKSNFFEKEGNKAYYGTHTLQLIGAARAVEQNFGIKVDKLYNWSPKNWRTAPGYTFDEKDIDSKIQRRFDAYWNVAIVDDIHRPEGRIFTCDLDAETWSYESYWEYAKRMLQ